MNTVKTYGAAGAALILVILGVIAWMRSPASDTVTMTTLAATNRPAADPMMEARTKGKPEAPISIYELSDFQCPFCKQFVDETLPALEEEYLATGKARLIFLNHPLIQIHANAAQAAEWAMCAAAQDGFWPMHDRLFETQDDWKGLSNPAAHFMSLAESVDLEREALQQCIDAGVARSIVAGDVRLAMQNRISSTPTFIIEGGVLQGAAPIEQWRPILDSIYAAKTGN